MLPNRVDLQELEHLRSVLSPEQRDELLQGLPTAAPRGGEAIMIKVLDQTLLCHAIEALLKQFADAQGGETDVNPDPHLL